MKNSRSNTGNTVFLHDAARRRWLLFRAPYLVLQTERTEEVLPILRQVDVSVQKEGLHAAGFISYEAGPAFDRSLEVKPDIAFPLVWFGLFDEPQISESPPLPNHSCSISDWNPSSDRLSYNRAIDRIKDCIADGETYQVNFTMRLKASFRGEPLALFHQLYQVQRADYAAFVDTGRYAICSASPELFFDLDGRRLNSRPMKGTAARGRWLEEDMAWARWLENDEKNRAENVMIVDMVRNDLGRIAEVGTVHVSRLFQIEKYPTLWQMTSTVSSNTKAELPEIMAALFPCASITGAPKPRTMRIIAELETTHRRVYTGCIGFMAPNRRAQFNVAIRTVIVDKETGTAEYGVGGGIVWDSEPRDEYEECKIKAKVLTEKRPEFELLETILWEPETGFFLLDYHLHRLEGSARYFSFAFNRKAAIQKLQQLQSDFTGPQRVRVLLSRHGALTCQATPLPLHKKKTAVRLGIASTPVNPSDIFLYHKTTFRKIYTDAQKSCQACDDVLLWNERGQITESCIANVVISHGGEWITPPVECGLLPGTYREWLLDQGKIREKSITMDMLKRAERVCLINSVRKWHAAEIDIDHIFGCFREIPDEAFAHDD